MWTGILWAAAVCAGLGLLGSVVLVLASRFLAVPQDERVGRLQEALPGANCGACGYAGCADYAKAIAEGAPVNKCVPGGEAVAKAAAAIMGVEAGSVLKRTAYVACQGSYEHTQDKYEYQGVQSCAAMAALHGGCAVCPFGCLGCGDCASACKFGAIEVKNSLAHIDEAKCTGCGACAETCPKGIIRLHTRLDKPVVLCANEDRGALTRKACTAGCIGCMKCAKNCPAGAVTVVNNVARIDEEKCTGCGVCAAQCPVGAIFMPAARA